MLALLGVLAGVPLAATAQEAIFLIRHAERAEGDDPPITEAGRARAQQWADMLGGVGLAKVFTTEARRTRETGSIIAEALRIETEALPTGDNRALLDVIEWDHEDDRVLIVGHTETIPDLLSALGAFDLVEMPKDDFARLFVVMPGDSEPVILDMRMP
jgi:phosphohistidine phosphatase SixA